MRYLFLLVFLLSLSCSPNSHEDFHAQGKSRIKALIKDFSKVKSRKDLEKIAPKLKTHFDGFASCLVNYQEYIKKHQPYDFDENLDPALLQLNQRLLSEIKRVYAIPGIREIVENAQKEALFCLDAYEEKQKRCKDLST